MIRQKFLQLQDLVAENNLRLEVCLRNLPNEFPASAAGRQDVELAISLISRNRHNGGNPVFAVVPRDGAVDFTAPACALDEIGYKRAAVIELEYEEATATEVRPDLGRAKQLLARDFAVA